MMQMQQQYEAGLAKYQEMNDQYQKLTQDCSERDEWNDKSKKEGMSKWKGPMCDDGNAPDCMEMPDRIESMEQLMDMQCWCEEGRDFYEIIEEFMEENAGRMRPGMNDGGDERDPRD